MQLRVALGTGRPLGPCAGHRVCLEWLFYLPAVLSRRVPTFLLAQGLARLLAWIWGPVMAAEEGEGGSTAGMHLWQARVRVYVIPSHTRKRTLPWMISAK